MNFIQKYKNIMVEKYEAYDNQKRKKLALMCVERQFVSYKYFAKKKQWDRTNEYRVLLNKCWEAIFKSEILDEEVWEIHESIKPETVNTSLEEYKELDITYANIFATNMCSYIEMLLDETGHEESFCLLNIDYILCYLNENNEKFYFDKYEENSLIRREIQQQQDDMRNIDDITNMEEVLKKVSQLKNVLIN